MKRLALLLLLALPLAPNAQAQLQYEQVLAGTHELDLTDGIVFEAAPGQLVPIDSLTVRKWFARLLPDKNPNPFKTRQFFLAGRVTTREHFDLVLVEEEKRKNDTNHSHTTYLVSLRKNGEFISFVKVAAGGNQKKTEVHITARMYPDLSLELDSRITVQNTAIAEQSYLRVSASGRFVITPRTD
ncbi:MAG: hypothetical protein RJA57_481 [Bacteroidota bacterium]|jgi:hypothetical protein